MNEALKLGVEHRSVFTLDLFKRYLETKKEDGGDESNEVMSPLSIATALAMAGAGAKGDTLAEITSVLKFSGGEAMHVFFSQIIADVLKDGSGLGGPLLTFATGLWVANSMILKPRFQGFLVEKYGADVKSADFANKGEEEWVIINSWASEKTKGIIKDLLPENCLNNTTKLALANALYFKGTWKNKFETEDTKDEEFHLLNGDTVHIPFLVTQKKQYIRKFDSYKVLRLPYVKGTDWDRSFSMYFVLPNDIGGLPDVERTLDAKSLNFQLSPQYLSREVRVGNFLLPRFKISTELRLPSVLGRLGMKKPFSANEADFLDMVEGTGASSLYISDVFHKAFIEVNEEGTEAAAVTAFLLTRQCYVETVEEPPEDFVANHPFLFILKEDMTGLVLFVGRITNPSLSI